MVYTGVKRGSHLFDYVLQSHDLTNSLNNDDLMREEVERDSIVQNIFAKVASELKHDDIYGEHDGWRCKEPYRNNNLILRKDVSYILDRKRWTGSTREWEQDVFRTEHGRWRNHEWNHSGGKQEKNRLWV